MVLAAAVPVSTSFLAEAVVESGWLISIEPMSGRLPTGCGRALVAVLAGGTGGQPVGAGERRVVDVVE